MVDGHGCPSGCLLTVYCFGTCSTLGCSVPVRTPARFPASDLLSSKMK